MVRSGIAPAPLATEARRPHSGPHVGAGHRSRESGEAFRPRRRRRRRQFQRAGGRRDGAARGQRRGQDDHDLHSSGPLAAHGGVRRRVRRGHAAASLSGAAPNEFLLALRRPAEAPDRGREPAGLCPALWPLRRPATLARGRRRLRSRRFHGSADRRPLRGTEDPRGPGQGLDKRARTVAARRAHGVARPRHGGLGARLSPGLPDGEGRDDPAGLSEHGRGGAHVRRRDRDARRADRGSRRAGGARRPLCRANLEEVFLDIARGRDRDGAERRAAR